MSLCACEQSNFWAWHTAQCRKQAPFCLNKQHFYILKYTKQIIIVLLMYFILSSFIYHIFVWRKLSSVFRLIFLNPHTHTNYKYTWRSAALQQWKVNLFGIHNRAFTEHRNLSFYMHVQFWWSCTVLLAKTRQSVTNNQHRFNTEVLSTNSTTQPKTNFVTSSWQQLHREAN
jgi:hypothetical protein